MLSRMTYSAIKASRGVPGMRKLVARILLVAASSSLLGLALPQSNALAHHNPGHHCRVGPHLHPKEFYQDQAEEEEEPRGQIRREHVHHKHGCKVGYPPRANKPKVKGQSFTLPAEEPAAGGLTVGTASLMALSGLGGLLVLRRRWVMRPTRR
jgi:hypothetical protein